MHVRVARCPRVHTPKARMFEHGPTTPARPETPDIRRSDRRPRGALKLRHYLGERMDYNEAVGAPQEKARRGELPS
jgi:hypothetical protein